MGNACVSAAPRPEEPRAQPKSSFQDPSTTRRTRRKSKQESPKGRSAKACHDDSAGGSVGGSAKGSAVGSARGSAVGSALSSPVGSARGSGIGSGVGSTTGSAAVSGRVHSEKDTVGRKGHTRAGHDRPTDGRRPHDRAALSTGHRSHARTSRYLEEDKLIKLSHFESKLSNTRHRAHTDARRRTRLHDERRHYDDRAYDGRGHDDRAYDGRGLEGRCHEGRGPDGRGHEGCLYEGGALAGRRVDWSSDGRRLDAQRSPLTSGHRALRASRTRRRTSMKEPRLVVRGESLLAGFQADSKVNRLRSVLDVQRAS